MGAIRRSRTTRPAPRSFQVAPRDRKNVMRAIGRMQYARTSHLEIFFGARSACSRRLAKLVALRLLNVFVPTLAGENVYSLTPRGVELLLEDGVDPGEIHRGGRPRRPDLAHILAINDVRIALVRAVRTRPEVAIDLFLADVDLRRAAGDALPPYVPDALVRLMTPAGPVGLVVELDTGSESPRYFATHKARPVQSLARTGAACWGLTAWRPVVVATSAKRLRALAEPVRSEGGGALWLAISLERVLQEGALARICTTFDEIAATPRNEPLPATRHLIDPAPRVF